MTTSRQDNSVTNTQASPFMSGVVWNMGSLVFLATTGFLLNTVIARVYGAEILGLFNICFALYIFFAQFGTYGLQMSMLQAVSEHAASDQKQLDAAASRGLWGVVVTSTVVSLLAVASTPIIVRIYPDLDKLAPAWLVMVPGLWAFSVNKVLFSIINGARFMRAFAILQSLRYIFMLAGLIALLLWHAPGYRLTAIFTIAEILILPFLLFFASKTINEWNPEQGLGWLRRHFWFGTRVFPSGAVLELNTRVDVLMIGLFLDPRFVGVYSIAILIAEGMSQAIFALRNNLNPLLAKMIAQGDTKALFALSRKVGLLFTPFMLGASVIGIVLFPYFSKYILLDAGFGEAAKPLMILLIGMSLAAPFMCFNMILSQAKRPTTHTLFVVSILVVNVMLNALLIPAYGINGAAFATAVSYLFSAVAILLLSRKILGVRLIF
jgi:O-antigen/teichoic acid export membrane protein